jgi:two-component system, LytTR family, sensor kinase
MTAIDNRLRKYALLFLVWNVLGVFLFSQSLIQKIVSREPTPWQHYLASWTIGMWMWFLLTPAVLWLGRRFPLERKSLLRHIPLHFFLSVLVTVVELATEAGILRSLRVFPTIMTGYAAALAFLLIIGFHEGLLTYWCILAVQYGFGWYRRSEERRREALRLQLHSSELEKRLMEAHLGALKMQLQPHFLFNTLNAITVLVRQQQGRQAEEMLSRLSDLLRVVLDDVEAQEVPFSRELEYLQLYLSIEQVRFADRLRVNVAVDPECLDAAVPYMALQPIVENAIRHGIGRSSVAGLLVISARRSGAGLVIEISDDGPGLTGGGVPKYGIGLANTRARLEQLYGAAASLSVENGQTSGAVARITLPYHFAEVNPAASPEKPISGTLEAHAAHGPVGR